jgi:hypothetical protein
MIMDIKMRFFTSLFFLILLLGCSQKDLSGRYPTPASLDTEDSRLVDEISNRVFLQLHKENKQLFPVECGGSMMDQIKSLHWGFFHYGEMDIEKAREILISAGNQFLIAFNEDERIRPYLATYPFTPERIEVNVFIKKSDGSELETDKLLVVSIDEGILNYATGTPDGLRLKTVLKETYEEAVMKLTNVAQSDTKIDDK